MIVLIVLGALVVAAVTVLALVLATGGFPGSGPVAAPTASPPSSPAPPPSPQPTPAPTSAPPAATPPPAPPAAFTAFSPADGSTVSCPDQTSSVPLSFTWSSTGADSAWIGVGTRNAKDAPYAQVPPSGSNNDITYQCSETSQIYTVTLRNPDGALTSNTVRLVRTLP